MLYGELANISAVPVGQSFWLIAGGFGLLFIMLLVLLGRVGRLAKSIQAPAGNTPAKAAATAAPRAAGGVPAEVVAAISAAVAFLEGDGAVVRSVAPAAAAGHFGVRAPGEWGFAARTAAVEPF